MVVRNEQAEQFTVDFLEDILLMDVRGLIIGRWGYVFQVWFRVYVVPVTLYKVVGCWFCGNLLSLVFIPYYYRWTWTLVTMSAFWTSL